MSYPVVVCSNFITSTYWDLLQHFMCQSSIIIFMVDLFDRLCCITWFPLLIRMNCLSITIILSHYESGMNLLVMIFARWVVMLQCFVPNCFSSFILILRLLIEVVLIHLHFDSIHLILNHFIHFVSSFCLLKNYNQIHKLPLIFNIFNLSIYQNLIFHLILYFKLFMALFIINQNS